MVEQVEALLIYKKIVEWAIPILLLALCKYLASISTSLIGIRQDMAVMMLETKNVKADVADLKVRVGNLEELR